MADHYFSDHPDSRSDIREISYGLGSISMRFLTDHGVFSISRVDHGTDLVLKTVLKDRLTAPESVLDMGCGYGPIGLTLAKAWPTCSVTMLDVNSRAMELAERNRVLNGLPEEIRIVRQEELAASRFEMVVTNPPVRAGKTTVYSLFALAQQHMAAQGALYVVLRKNQGAPSAAKELIRLFGNCEIINRQSGYHILKSRKAE